MLTSKEKMELVLSSLSSLEVDDASLEFLKGNYEEARKNTLSEDLFMDESFSDTYFTMRKLDSATADYIKALESKVVELKKLVVGFGVGTVQDKAEEMKKILNNLK